MHKKILVVEEEERLRTLIQSYLRHEGFEIVTAQNGHNALTVARQVEPDLIILDLMKPESESYAFLRIHRQASKTPTILLIAESREPDAKEVNSLRLELGVEECVTKPFGMRELTARIHTVLRRTGQTPPAPEVLHAADMTVDRDNHLVTVGKQHFDLTPSEFDLLTALIGHPGRAFSRTELIDRLQGTTFDGYERIIDVHIRNLRSKIEPDPRRPRYIKTVFGVGYRFTA